jgi:hypothetical protein
MQYEATCLRNRELEQELKALRRTSPVDDRQPTPVH